MENAQLRIVKIRSTLVRVDRRVPSRAFVEYLLSSIADRDIYLSLRLSLETTNASRQDAEHSDYHSQTSRCVTSAGAIMTQLKTDCCYTTIAYVLRRPIDLRMLTTANATLKRKQRLLYDLFVGR